MYGFQYSTSLTFLKRKKKNHEMSVSTSLVSQNNTHDPIGTHPQNQQATTSVHQTHHPIASDPALKRLAQNNPEAPPKGTPVL
jgi:hypothetical protein